jgi:hypothetical protein
VNWERGNFIPEEKPMCSNFDFLLTIEKPRNKLSETEGVGHPQDGRTECAGLSCHPQCTK